MIYQGSVQLGLFLQCAGICMRSSVFVRTFIVIESHCLVMSMY